MPHTMNRPKQFPGTPEEKAANYATHHWGTLDGENWECYNCAAKTFHTGATWPCGTPVPREDVVVNDPPAFTELFPEAAGPIHAMSDRERKAWQEAQEVTDG